MLSRQTALYPGNSTLGRHLLSANDLYPKRPGALIAELHANSSASRAPRHPAEITSQDVQRWPDQLISQKKSAPRQSPLSSPLCARSSIIFRLEGTSVITRRSLSWCRRPLSRKICAGGHSRRKRCVTC